MIFAHPFVALVLAVVTIHVAVLTFYVAPFIPLITAAITKAAAPGWLKTGTAAGLAVIVAAVTTAIDAGSDLILTWSFLGKVGMAIAVSIVSYLIARKPLIERIEKRTGHIGISA